MTPEQFVLINDLFSEATFLLTASGVILAANTAVAHELGIRPEDLQGKSLFEFVASPRDALAQYLRSCSRTREKLPGALTFRKQDGQSADCRAEGKLVQPALDRNEAVILLKLMPKEAAVGQFLILNHRIEDLTREVALRKKAEEQARAQREWLHVTLSSIGDAVIATDAEGRVDFLNPVAEEMTGWSQAEAAGRRIAEVFNIVNEQTRQRPVDPVERALSEGRVVGLANHTVLIARGGTERPIDDCGAPIRDGNGKVVGAVLVFHDVTERRLMERELRERADKLLEADKRKNEWIAMLAHELRGPLNPVRNAVEVLSRKATADPDIQQAASVIGRQTQHMAQIVSDLLDTTRLAHGHLQLRKERVDLVRLARTATEDFLPILNQSEIAGVMSGPEIPLWVQADATRMTQILFNLLDNARKFTLKGGKVHVSVEEDRDGKVAILKVVDTGVGLDPALLPKLFQPFSQADRSLDRSKGGLGLGLALVKGLVELHGGTIEAGSAGEVGAAFSIRLPLEKEPAPLAALPATTQPSKKRHRILIVEDNKDGADSLQMLLTLLGHEVRVAYSGPDGVAQADVWRPDVVLCDIGLPGLDGYGVAVELHKISVASKARLIAITGYGSHEDREQAMRAGFHHHLTKPADPKELFKLLDLAG